MIVQGSKVIIYFICIVIILSSCGDKPKPSESSKTQKPATKTEQTTKKVVSPKETKVDSEKEPIPEEFLTKARSIIKSVSDEDVAAVDGKAKYKVFCSSCHGFKGKLMISGATDLSKSKLTIEENVAQIYHGKGLMTPFKGLLSEAEIVAVSKYTATLNN